MKCNQSNKSCNECPFSKASPSGQLGGSPIQTYLGQILGPFYLPCHMPQNYKGNDTPVSPEHMQCAGAAIFRRKLGVRVPAPLLTLQSDDSNVFSTLEEFISHHDPSLTPEGVKSMADMARTGFYTRIEYAIAASKNRAFRASEMAEKFSQDSEKND